MLQIVKLRQMFWNSRKGDFTYKLKKNVIIKALQNACEIVIKKNELRGKRGPKQIKMQSIFAYKQTKNAI